MKFKLIVAVVLCGIFFKTRAQQSNSKAINGLIARVLPAHHRQIQTETIEDKNGNDVFEIESIMGKIVLRGNNHISKASALNWYLKYYCHVQQSWCGDNMDLPKILPSVKDKVHITSPYKDRVYLNYCTFNYSMSWWTWERWEKEIDWMAMKGINMPLAVTGQEAVWQNTLRKYGMSDEEIRAFLVGPAYSAWQWMTNIESIFGPLPQQWIDRSVDLGKRIIQRERELGMTPILQGFTGFVPIKLMDKQPQANIIKKPIWYFVGQGTAQLDPLDPLFAKMSTTFIQEQTKLFGTNHIYAADPFHESKPPKEGDEYLAAVGKAVYETTIAVDPQAIIAMQTWSMKKPIVQAIPENKILMLDLNTAKWKGSEAFWGKPWVAGVIHNFGGNTAMGGDLDAVLGRYPDLLANKATKKIQGIGMFPEAIEHNPVIYEAASEMAWYTKKPDTKEWLHGYLKSRYGSLDNPTIAAWDILLATAYGKYGVETFRESAICARPALLVNGASPNGALNSEKNYRFKSLWEAIELLKNANAQIRNKDTYKYDLVDLMRQSMADLAIPIQQQMANAYRKNEAESFANYSKQFLDLMDDFDELLGNRKEFLLGKWIADARAVGKTSQEKDLYEKNARSLITIWGPYDPNAMQYDYSARQWNGMVSDYYKPRWSKYIDFLNTEMSKDINIRYKEININHRWKRPKNEVNDFYKMISKWEADWGGTHNNNLLTTPQKTEIEVVEKLYNKWKTVAEKEYVGK
jgi:alpha-N-acetylglucosaminidase